MAQYREIFWSYSTVFKKLFHNAEYVQDTSRGNDEVLSKALLNLKGGSIF